MPGELRLVQDQRRRQPLAQFRYTTGIHVDCGGDIEATVALSAVVRLSLVAEELTRQFNRQVSLVQTEYDLLQVMHCKAGKSKALRFVAKLLEVSRAEVLAIGDNANDVAMLRWAGVSVAVANAPQLVKDAAAYVAAGNDAEGVAAAVTQLVLDGRIQSSQLIPRAQNR